MRLDNAEEICNIKEMEIFNELRSPLDMVEDMEWANSDHVGLAGMYVQCSEGPAVAAGGLAVYDI